MKEINIIFFFFTKQKKIIPYVRNKVAGMELESFGQNLSGIFGMNWDSKLDEIFYGWFYFLKLE